MSNADSLLVKTTMSIDLEIPGSLLNSLVSNQLQEKFNTTCFPPFPNDDGETTDIDSITVQSVTNAVSTSAIDFPADAQLLLLSQSDLDASVGGLAPDLTVLTAQIALQMVPNGAQLSFVCQFITLSPPDPALQKLINQFVVPSFSSFGAIDLTTLFQTLGTDVPQNTEFARFGGSVIIRFDPNSPPSDHLINGLQWGIFIPSSVLETLVDNLIGTAAGTQLQENGFSVGNPITTYMGSQTGNAYLEATLSGTKPDSCLGENFTVTAAFDFKINMYLQNQGPLRNPQLAKMVWFNLNLSSNVVFDLFGFVENALDAQAVVSMASFDVSTVGGTRLSQPGTDYYTHNFEILSDLPQFSFRNASLYYSNSLIAQDDGMILGGGVYYTPPPPLFDLTYTVTKLDPFTYTQWTYCGEQPSDPFVHGTGTLTNTAQLCSATIVSPTSTAAQSVVTISTTPSPGEPANQVTVSVYMTVAAASVFLSTSKGQHLVVQVETTRGCACSISGPRPRRSSTATAIC
jgi:hypothetical protein